MTTHAHAHQHHHHQQQHPAASNQTASAATLGYIKGIDVSHWDGKVDWNKVKASGVEFAFAKATDGNMKHPDKTFSTNWAQMKTAGLVRGAYHFGHPKHSAVDQAKKFYDAVQPTAGDLYLALDLEDNDGMKPAAVWTWTQAFLAELQRLSGQPSIIYVGYYFWLQQVGNPKNNLNCPLWLASYTHHPQVPPAWTDWTIWQYTSKGHVAGIGSHVNVDLDYFKGTLNDLKQLTFPQPYKKCEVKDWF